MATFVFKGNAYTAPAVEFPDGNNGWVRFSEGGGTPSQTQHTLYWEYSDGTNETEITYWNGTFVSDAIEATKPLTHNNKTVTLAKLDNREPWYNPANIPLNTELIDISEVTWGQSVGDDGSAEESQWSSITDYILIDPAMTFSYVCNRWSYYAYYDENHAAVRVVEVAQDIDSYVDNTGYGTLTPAKIPANAKYVRFTGGYHPETNDNLSLIRTA